jgi:hypothetical protein
MFAAVIWASGALSANMSGRPRLNHGLGEIGRAFDARSSLHLPHSVCPNAENNYPYYRLHAIRWALFVLVRTAMP